MGGIYWLASYPKSGNTWLRAFLHNLLLDGAKPADITTLPFGEIASSRGWLDRVLCFDTSDLSETEVERLRPAVYRWTAQSAAIRYHKIHDAYSLTTDGVPLVSREGTLGALYILRNPLDVAISAANHWHDCSIDRAIEIMGRAETVFSRTTTALAPQASQRLLSWSAHVLSWVDAPDLAVEVIRYEDMQTAPLATFTRAAQFLGLPDEPPRVEKAIRFSAFRELARQEQEKGFGERLQHSERFFRTGTSGVWRRTLSDDQVARVIADHGAVMRRFGYLDDRGNPIP